MSVASGFSFYWKSKKRDGGATRRGLPGGTSVADSPFSTGGPSQLILQYMGSVQTHPVAFPPILYSMCVLGPCPYQHSQKGGSEFDSGIRGLGPTLRFEVLVRLIRAIPQASSLGVPRVRHTFAPAANTPRPAAHAQPLSHMHHTTII